MPTYCSQLKTEYEHLQTLTKEFVLEYEKAKADSNPSWPWKLKDQLEAARDALKEKLNIFITETKALAGIEKLLKEGANKSWVAEGLAGLDSTKAWDLRERLLKEGAHKGSVAIGLAGDYITFVWQLKRKGKSGFSSGNIHK